MNSIITLVTYYVYKYSALGATGQNIMQHICNIMQYGQVFVQCAYAFIISQLPCSRVHVYASAFEGFAQAHTRFFEEATKVGIYRVTVVMVKMR